MSGLQRFHQEMATLDGPMIVVTASAGGQRGGCLVGFHTQVSIEPARYLVCLSIKNHTYEIARRADHLAVHFLGHEQIDMAVRFGGQCGHEVDKFAGLDVSMRAGATPVLSDCAHWFLGRILATLPINDHVAFALEPVESGGIPERQTLLGFQAVKDVDPGHDP